MATSLGDENARILKARTRRSIDAIPNYSGHDSSGIPKEAFGFYPTTHDGGDAILLSCGRGIVFGSDATVKKYAKYSNIQVHGSGRSKVLIGQDMAEEWEKHLDVMVESVSANGGRSCINASSVLVPSHFNDIADALAQKLAAIEPCSRDDEHALLCGFANAEFAKMMDEAIDDALKTPGAVDLTAKYRNGPRLVEKFGQTFLCPTLIACSDPSHPLANTEYMFPFVSVVEMPQSEMLTSSVRLWWFPPNRRRRMDGRLDG